MFGCLRSCVGRIVLAVIVVGLVVAGLWWGPDLEPRVRAWLGGESVEEEGPTPELAESTLDRFETFMAGDRSEQLSLGDHEISSVIRYALPGILPPGVSDPSVEMVDGKIHLSARVATEAFPDLPSLEEVVGFLPDTVNIRMIGTLQPFGAEQAALHVDRVEALRVPIPDRFIPRILTALGRQHRQGLPPDAMLVPLPEGLKSAYILRDSLVLVADD